MSNAPQVRNGFTLSELIAVVTIISVLLALLIPALQQVREHSRQRCCSNNLRRISLAMHYYHDSQLGFPPGNRWDRGDGPRYPTWANDNSWGWAAFLLPFLDQQKLYEDFDFSTSPWTSEIADPYFNKFGPSYVTTNKKPCQSMPSLFVCPSVTRKGPENEFKDYGINGGGDRFEYKDGKIYKRHFCCPERGTMTSGIAFLNSSVRMSEIPDGTSDTFMFLEARHWAKVPQDYPIHDVPTNPFVWVNQQSPGYVTGISMPNTVLPSDKFSGRVAQSSHPDGILVSYCDGRVVFLNENIDRRTYLAVLNRHGGEPVSGF